MPNNDLANDCGKDRGNYLANGLSGGRPSTSTRPSRDLARLALPCVFQRFETETHRRWQREGYPRDTHAATHFGFDRVELAPVNFAPLPAFERAEIEDAEEWRLGGDRELTDELEGKLDTRADQYPLISSAGWATLRARLDAGSPARYPRFWDDYRRTVADRDYPLGLCLPGPFSSLIEWLGPRCLTEALIDQPDWVREMVEYLATFAVDSTRRALADLELNFALVAENSAYQAGVVAGAAFGPVFGQWYRAVAAAFGSVGKTRVIVEARGNVAAAIPVWVSEGIGGLAGLEAAAGIDAGEVRREFGADLLLVGGFDHLALAAGKRAIRDELRARQPLLVGGGYILAPDAPVSSEVALESYEYYLDQLRKLG